MLIIKISFFLKKSLQQFFQKLKLSIVANRNVSFYKRTIYNQSQFSSFTRERGNLIIFIANRDRTQK